MVSMDFDTAWCPVCEQQIPPKRTTQVLPTDQPTGIARQRTPQNRPVLTRTKTVIDQGPSPLYCSDQCKMADMLHHREDAYAPPTYPIYRSSQSDKPENAEGSSPSDFESDSLSSTTTDISSPTSENLPSNPITVHPKQRSRSFLSGRSSRSSGSRHAPSSLPTTSTLLKTFGDFDERSTHDEHLLSQFQGSFSRRSESRVSLYSGPSSPTSRSPPSLSSLSTSPRRERPLLAHGAEGKLLVPDVYVRVPSRPCASRRESSSSLASMASAYSAPGAFSSSNRTGSMASIGSSRASLRSPLARHGSEFGDDEKDHDLSEEEEDDHFEDSHMPLSPGFGGFGFAPSTKRPALSDMRARSCDAFSNPLANPFLTIRKERRKSDKKEDRKSYNPDGQKLFLFPTDY
ncbi:hypothetical protein BT96DRAFT_944325 [Gymnopus androsaceus JB14]|uniref:Uncharacterized protein n=1 Tax=Gymnopus androsaceus JB14 TaxID=1447944 RepID=A0A6A4H442_9AGAR|nr:hypothetical protein BT96DRAFT_944325 [Gymnopus androsaceus JB14]